MYMYSNIMVWTFLGFCPGQGGNEVKLTYDQTFERALYWESLVKLQCWLSTNILNTIKNSELYYYCFGHNVTPKIVILRVTSDRRRDRRFY